MRLRRLELQNFRRHRHTVWEIPDGVTAVVGANGAGKSTLLEAIGFALYGPRATRTAKDLLRWQGAAPADSVTVTLEAEIAGQAWSITRELRGRSQEPRASLVVDRVPIVAPGAGSSEQATAKVEQTLGLDRDGFFQTVVARQGELDRLAQMKPADRRTFILDMVGIGAADAAIARARAERNAARARLDEALHNMPDPSILQGRIEGATKAEHAAAALLAAQTGHREQGHRAHAEVQRALVAERAVGAARQAALADVRLAELRLQQAEATQRDVALRVAGSMRAQQRHAELLPRAVALDALQERHEAAVQRESILRARTEGLARAARLRAECDAMARKLASDAADVAPPAIDGAQDALQAATASHATAAAQADQAKAAAAAIQNRARRLQALGAETACPTCTQPLTPDHLARMHGDFAAELAAARQALEGAEELAARLGAERTASETRVALARAAREAWERRARLQAEATAALEARRAAMTEVERGVPPEPPAAEAAGAVAQLLHDARAARDEALQLLMVAQQLRALEAQQAVVMQEAQRAALLLRTAADHLAEVPDNGSRLAALEAQARQVAESVRQAEKGVLQAALAYRDAQRDLVQAKAMAEDAQRRQAHARELADDLAVWTALSSSSGDGLLDRFKDHLIARTAPRIQLEASRLLSAFTQGKYSEMILDEDYEVWIRDGAERYAIQRFSGGEQDLAHLALRLAISRLLATRANGAEIRLLALDEVFGSLDVLHRDLVVAALHQLGGIYSQVLAITHDEGLQDVLDQAVRVDLVDGEARLTGSSVSAGSGAAAAGPPAPAAQTVLSTV